MTHTTNFNLSQWAKSDRIQMADFNADNQKIDAALASCCRSYFASYTGTGATSRTFTFTGKPVMLVILGSNNLMVIHRGLNSGCTYWGGSAQYQFSVSWGDTSVTLSTTGPTNAISNGANTDYGLFAILETN